MDKRTGLMSMAYPEFAAFMADVDEAFATWDKVTTSQLDDWRRPEAFGIPCFMLLYFFYRPR